MDNDIMHKDINYGELHVAEPLEDILSIEDVAIEIERLTEKVDLYKRWKKKKVNDADNEIKKTNNKIEFLKDIIIKTLQKNKKNNLILPGSCKVIKRKAPDKWEILDEDKFIKFLKKENEFDKIVNIVFKNNIDKKLASELLNDLEKSGNIPECVIKETGKIGLSVSFVKEEDVEEEIEHVLLNQEEENYDKLDFA